MDHFIVSGDHNNGFLYLYTGEMHRCICDRGIVTDYRTDRDNRNFVVRTAEYHLYHYMREADDNLWMLVGKTISRGRWTVRIIEL